MHDLLLDIRYALRVLWKSPAFTLVALVTLMLGIGANVLVFGVNAVLLHPLEVSAPQNLYQLRIGSWTSGKALTTSYPAFGDIQQRNTTFSDIGGFLTGRDVSWHDIKTTPYVAIVNQTFARKMWGETPAIGQRFILMDHLTEVVGVTEDGKYYEIMEPQQPVVFLPLLQTENAVAVFVVRTTRAQNEMVTALERTLSAIEPDALITVQSWPDAMARVLFPARAASVGLGVMGLLAAMLAVTGIFGMAAYNVSRRIKELGIRVALGARTKHVMSAAVGRPIVLLGLGSLAGLLLGVFASRLLEHVVYQANPRDPVVVVSAVLTMALLGIAASAIPSLRALAVDPSKLLREE